MPEDKERETTEPPPDLSRLLNSQEVADLLGISRRTVEKWVQDGRLPYVKFGTAGRGSLLRFRPESLREWIAAQEVKPDAGK